MNGIPPNGLTSTPERIRVGSADCAICLENDLEPVPLMSTTMCNHTFHKICLDKWLKMANSCPMCRAVLSNRAVEPIERIMRHVARSHAELDLALESMSRTIHTNGERLVEQTFSLSPQQQQNVLAEIIQSSHAEQQAERRVSMLSQRRQNALSAMARRTPYFMSPQQRRSALMEMARRDPYANSFSQLVVQLTSLPPQQLQDVLLQVIR